MQTVPESILLGAALVLANWRALMFIYLYPDTSRLWGAAWIEILLWVIVTAGFAYLVFQNNLLSDYLSLWRENWLLILFLLLAFISILWSIGPLVTLFRALELLFATLIAAYIGTRFQPEQFMDILFWFGAGLFILSIALVFGAPRTGTMYWAPFYGAWRGVYWHRNHLASITALLSAVYLVRALLVFQSRNSKGILDGFFYIVSLVVLYFAKSATGYIVFLLLNVLAVGVWLWLQSAHRLQRRHYIFILSGIAVAVVLVLLNLNFVFGLLHRDTTLTGRLGLWRQLLEIASQRLWFGHGFGAVWTFDSFREQVRQLAGWPSQPLVGDNGFLDIFLHLGIVGLILFVGVLIIATVRSFRYGFTQKTLTGFFPLMIMVYAFFANITFSLFAETEVFIWLLIAAILFMTMPSSNSERLIS
jgi:O-antigen ligase